MSEYADRCARGILLHMPIRIPIIWRPLAAAQAGILSRAQLQQLGLGNDYVDTQVAAERWQAVSSVVVATTTGVLTREQLMWAGVLHAGPHSAIGGLTALEVRGLRHWHRDDVTVLLPKSHNLEPVHGIDFVETRRPVRLLCGPGDLPLWRVEPAALLWAAYEPVTRSAYGLLAAVVQQRLSTPDRLEHWIGRMRPLRRAKPFRRVLGEMAGGSESGAELDVLRMCDRHGLSHPLRQVRRRDSAGRLRFTDAEWRLPGGRVAVLEVDGGHHMEAHHWEADIERERGLVATGTIVLRCTSVQLRDGGADVARDLRRVGVSESSA